MSHMVKVYNSTIGQKILVALTGLFLCSFLIVHLSGNMLLFKDDGGAAFDHYSEFMSTNFAIRTMEIGLFAGFILHMLFGLRTWLHNRSSRPERYKANRPQENSTFASRWMFFNGSVVFIFLVVHLNSFFVPARFDISKPSMYELVKTAFASPLYDAFYLVALILLGYHLRQGFQSAFQTFGLRPAWLKPIEWISAIFWLIIPLGFATMPIYFYYMGGN